MDICKNCHAGCCRRFNPYLWGSDILRIINALKVDINFFTTARKLTIENYEELKGKEPIFKFTDSGQEEYFVLVLKINESKIIPGTSKCIFLQEWSAKALGSEELTGIIGRCGIYGIRPSGCRTWPAVYEPDTKSVIINDPHLILDKKQKRPGESFVYDICARTMEHEDYSQYEDEYVHDAIINYHEKAFFIKLSEKWNKTPDVSDKLYQFLLDEYSNRIEYIKEEPNCR